MSVSVICVCKRMSCYVKLCLRYAMLCYAVFISLYVYVNVLCDAMPGYEKLWYVYYVCSECSAVQ